MSSRRGGRCTHCDALLIKENESCGYCGGAVSVVDGLIELITERVVDQDRKVERVQGAAAQRLKEVGSVGALLGY